MVLRSTSSRACLLLAVLVAFAGANYAQETAAPVDSDSSTEITSETEQKETAQPPVESPAQNDVAAADVSVSTDSPRLQFAFEGTPWRDVVKWLAESGNLALHISDVPTGSFSYTDDTDFTVQGAINRVNLFLLPEGFALIRSGRLLSLINLTDRQSTQQLDALATLVTSNELDAREDYEVVKCLFSLGEMKAEDAVEELSGLNLMVTPATFPRTNQLLLTDTAAKLRAARSILDKFAPETMDNGTVVQGFQLKFVDAEDALQVIRPHLGLATGEMIGIDVSLSADTKGRGIFVTGIEDKVKLIEGLIKSIDIPENGATTTAANAQLKSYPVSGGNLSNVYDVLLTLLSGKNVRLSADQEAEAIVALAAPEIQQEIEQTVAQLQAADKSFEVIELNGVDPYFAISLIEQMLDLPDELLDDPDTIDPDAPRIDADSANGRLFVRARPREIEEIKKIIAGLETQQAPSQPTEVATGMQVYPVKGEAAVRLLKTAVKFWRRDNPVIFYPPVETPAGVASERVVAGEDSDGLTQPPPKRTESPTAQFLTDNLDSQAAPIRCQLSLRGLLIQCDEEEVVSQFVKHLDAVGGPVADAVSPPVVFYLKYARPGEALKMLAELLDGGEAAREAESSSLVNGYVSSGSYYLSIITSRDGTMTMLNGTITVVAETRLNRLIAQGTAKDIELIERYLKIIDKDKSITTIETNGRSHIIALAHSKAEDVATALREAYAGRVVASATNQPRQQQGNQRQRNPQQGGGDASQNNDQQDDRRNDRRRGEDEAEGEAEQNDQNQQRAAGGGGSATNLEPKMTIAVHEPSNSLIVTAPEQLFLEVEALAKEIDERSKQTVNVIKLPSNVPFDSLQRVLSGQGSGRNRTGRATPEPRTGS